MNSVQFVALYTILRREVSRMFRIWQQTLLPPVITQSLYFTVFGSFIGSQIAPIQGISYMAYIVPGIIMMSIIMGAYMNVVFSFFGIKFMRSVEEMMVSPMKNSTMLMGYALSGVARAFLTGSMVFLVSMVFVRPTVMHPFVILAFAFLTSYVFALGGFLNALFAKDFDSAGTFSTFVLTPLIYLGGVFYSIDSLPPFFRLLSHANPIVYMVDGFRFGFYGVHDTNPWMGAAFLIAVAGALTAINLHFLKKGTGLRS